MPQFTVNALRFDPYKYFKFRVIWDGRVVSGISHVSALVRTTEEVSYRNGGDPSTVRRMPGHWTSVSTSSIRTSIQSGRRHASTCA